MVTERCVEGVLLLFALPGCAVLMPARSHTGVAESADIRLDLTRRCTGSETESGIMELSPVGAGVAISYLSKQAQAAIGSDAGRYQQRFSASVIATRLWTGPASAPRLAFDTVSLARFTEDHPDGGEPAEEFAFVVTPLQPGADGLFAVRPASIRIREAAAKLLQQGPLSVPAWFRDTTRELDLSVTVRVESLTEKGVPASETSIDLPRYDMGAPGHELSFKAASTVPANATVDIRNLLGILRIPPPDDGSQPYYRITLTVTEKDPLNASIDEGPEKDAIRNLADAIGKSR